MRRLLGLKSELKQQRARLHHHRSEFSRNKQLTQAALHRNITSLTALFSSFAAGAATGWWATKPTVKTPAPDADVDVDVKQADKVDVEVSSNPWSSTLLDEAIAVGISLLMNELTGRATSILDSAKQKQETPDEQDQPTSDQTEAQSKAP